MSPTIRDARDDDAEALIALIGGCYMEYEGCILDVENENPGLKAVASHFAAAGGRFWVAEQDGRIVGSVGVRPAKDPDGTQLHYLYVHGPARRGGLASRLVALAEEEARAGGAAFVTLWTDTRFAAAHRFYERLGYVRQPGTRRLDDCSRSVEYRYVKALVDG